MLAVYWPLKLPVRPPLRAATSTQSPATPWMGFSSALWPGPLKVFVNCTTPTLSFTVKVTDPPPMLLVQDRWPSVPHSMGSLVWVPLLAPLYATTPSPTHVCPSEPFAHPAAPVQPDRRGTSIATARGTSHRMLQVPAAGLLMPIGPDVESPQLARGRPVVGVAARPA